jgi:hexosaminidase
MLPPLLPRPRRSAPHQGALDLRDGLPIVLEPSSSAADFASACALRDAIARACGRRLPIETHARSHDLGPRIELHREAEGGDAYRLAVARDRALAVGAGPAGLRYAAETLGQLVDARGRIPACSVDDAPDFRLRGLMLDVSRGKVPTLETLEHVVDLCVRLKLNALMLYTEHTFRFRRHPEIGADASPLEAETLRTLDAYAAERHVELIPTLQTLGHMGHVLKLERYRHLAESELGWSLAPAEPGTAALLDDLLAEYLPNFRSRHFNANCDEPWDLGRGRSKAREEELGPGGVFLEHVAFVREAARQHGKRTMIWADVVHRHPDRLGEIPRDLILLDWWYEADLDYDRVSVFREHGLDFAVCPGTSSWNCLFPRVANSLANIARFADAGRRHGALGLVCTDWGDFGHYNLQGLSWLGFAYAAQQAWSGDVPEAEFDRAFGRLLFGEGRGAVARAWRALGGVHDAGFRVANGSPLQFLFFDDLDRAFFLRQARPAALRRSARAVARARALLARTEGALAGDRLTAEELGWAAEASAFALEKAEASLAWLRWRDRPKVLTPGERRLLARRLARLAGAQVALGRRLRRLFHARSRPSNFEITARRLQASVASLRRAARALERGAPPPPDPRAATMTLADVYRELRALAEGRG